MQCLLTTVKLFGRNILLERIRLLELLQKCSDFCRIAVQQVSIKTSDEEKQLELLPSMKEMNTSLYLGLTLHCKIKFNQIHNMTSIQIARICKY